MPFSRCVPLEGLLWAGGYFRFGPVAEVRHPEIAVVRVGASTRPALPGSSAEAKAGNESPCSSVPVNSADHHSSGCFDSKPLDDFAVDLGLPAHPLSKRSCRHRDEVSAENCQPRARVTAVEDGERRL